MSIKEMMKQAWAGKSPYLRKIATDEIVIEHDDCTREEGLKFTDDTVKKLGGKYSFEVWDHNGKCPHIHVRNIIGLRELSPKKRMGYKKSFLLKYAGNPDKVDLSLTGKHMIAKENAPHWKILAKNMTNYKTKRLISDHNEGMPNKIEEDLIELSKKKLKVTQSTGDILLVAQKHGVEINSQNQALCIFHDENTPSMTFYQESNNGWCFGCDTWFDIETLEKKLESHAPVDISVLQDKNLLNILCSEISKKVVGDGGSVRFDLIALCSVFLNNARQNPNIMKSSQSSSGKSHITKSVCKLFELTGRIVMCSKITPQALAYYGADKKEFTWDSKLLYIEDAQHCLMNSETFKVFVSDGLSRTISVKDGKSQEISIKGKPTIFTTTANVDLQDEMSNRFIVVNVDETHEQIGKVLEFQAKICVGGSQQYSAIIRNALKGLKNVEVSVPYANKIWEQFHVGMQRVKRDFDRFLALIQSHAALYQHQRERDKEGRVIATGEDYEVVRKLYQQKVLDKGNFFGLSHREKRALEQCIVLIARDGPVHAAQIHATHAYVSLNTWCKWLGKLSNLGLLDTACVSEDLLSKPVTKYRVGEPISIKLKTFEKLKVNEPTEATSGVAEKKVGA